MTINTHLYIKCIYKICVIMMVFLLPILNTSFGVEIIVQTPINQHHSFLFEGRPMQLEVIVSNSSSFEDIISFLLHSAGQPGLLWAKDESVMVAVV